MNRKKKLFFGLIAGFIACIMVVLSVPYYKTTTHAADNVRIKYVDSAQKVLQKTEYTGPEQATLTVTMAKGETESIQIILTPNQEVSSVEVVTYDLYDGYAKLPKENIEVYWEKYLEITKKFNDNPNYSKGSFVPDALLPMETAVSYNENKIAANENQGIWLDITTTSGTPTAKYSGQIEVIVDGKKYSHELIVNVLDIDLSAVEGEVNFWSLHMRDSFATNEMDSSDEMAAAYFEKLLEYNVQTDLPFSGEGGAEAFAQMVKKYYDYPGFSSYRFYYERSNYWEAGVLSWYVNPKVLEEYVRALAMLSVEDHRNYFDKAFFLLLNIIDEPYSEDAYKKVELAYGRLHTALADISERLLEEFAGHDNYYFYEEVVKQCIANIPLTIAESMPTVADTLENEYGLDYITHNASLAFYDTLEKREEYNSYVESLEDGDSINTEKWWYTCVSPTYPYPSNHLDDDVLGLKTLFWMQNLYEVDGHLNWAVSYYQDGSSNGIGRDPYTDGDYMGVLPMGDGYMTYPGYPYGIYGPVMSIRLAVMRDGVDDAKYMEIIRSLYAEQGADASEYLASICKPIFTGTKTTNDVEAYNEVQTEIINTILTLKGKFGVMYQSVESTKTDVTIQFVLSDRTTQVYYKDKLIDAIDGVYTIRQSLSESGTISFTMKNGDKEKTVKKYITGKLYLVADFDSESELSLVQVADNSAKDISTEQVCDGTASLKLSLNRIGNSANMPYMKFDTSKINKGNFKEIGQIYISIYNDQNVDITVTPQYFVGDRFISLSTQTLKAKQWTDITLDEVSGWTKVDQIDGLFFFADDSAFVGTPVKLYVDSFMYSTIE